MELVLLVVVLMAWDTTWASPKLCDSVQCPPIDWKELAADTYRGVLTNDTTYVSAHFKCQFENCLWGKRQVRQLYMRNFAYVRGFNSQGMNLHDLGSGIFHTYGRFNGDKGLFLYSWFYLSNPSPPAAIAPFAEVTTLKADATFYAREYTTVKPLTNAMVKLELLRLKVSLDGLGLRYVENADYTFGSYDVKSVGTEKSYMVAVRALLEQ